MQPLLHLLGNSHQSVVISIRFLSIIIQVTLICRCGSVQKFCRQTLEKNKTTHARARRTFDVKCASKRKYVGLNTRQIKPLFFFTVPQGNMKPVRHEGPGRRQWSPRRCFSTAQDGGEILRQSGFSQSRERSACQSKHPGTW